MPASEIKNNVFEGIFLNTVIRKVIIIKGIQIGCNPLKELTEITKEIIDTHSFSVYDWEDSEDWIDRLIERFSPLVREYYLNYEELKRELNKVLSDETDFTRQDIDTCLDVCLSAGIPDPAVDRKKEQLRTYRSDFAEILAMVCLEELFDTNIPVKGIRYREIQEAPGRGIDIIGYEEKAGIIHLILCEVKGSSSSKNPPACVSGNNDSIEKQLLSCITDKKKTLNRLSAIFAKCDKDQKFLMARIILSWQMQRNDKMKIILCPFLLREREKYKEEDFKFLQHKLELYHPGVIRFLIVCINANLSEISKKLYEFAPHLEVHHDD